MSPIRKTDILARFGSTISRNIGTVSVVDQPWLPAIVTNCIINFTTSKTVSCNQFTARNNAGDSIPMPDNPICQEVQPEKSSE